MEERRHGEALCQGQSSRATQPDPPAGGVAQLRRPSRSAGPTPWDDRGANRLTPAVDGGEPSYCPARPTGRATASCVMYGVVPIEFNPYSGFLVLVILICVTGVILVL